jgi:hypothetical protein
MGRRYKERGTAKRRGTGGKMEEGRWRREGRQGRKCESREKKEQGGGFGERRMQRYNLLSLFFQFEMFEAGRPKAHGDCTSNSSIPVHQNLRGFNALSSHHIKVSVNAIDVLLHVCEPPQF